MLNIANKITTWSQRYHAHLEEKMEETEKATMTKKGETSRGESPGPLPEAVVAHLTRVTSPSTPP